MNMLKVSRLLSHCIKSVGSKTFNFQSQGLISMDHLQRTAENTRSRTSKATIGSVSELSTTVKKLTLKIESKELSFKPGQWVDFFIPNLSTVGGFSMCSSPTLLEEKKLLNLAIKRSDHPPAKWVHTECKEGSEVTVTVGGDFYLDTNLINRPLLFIAGGVGINPLFSMFQFAAEKLSGTSNPAVLLYSAQSEEELIFKDDINNLVKTHDFLNVNYHVTREEPESVVNYSKGRIDADTIKSCIENFYKNREIDITCYICGPAPFIDSMENYLLDSGVRKGNIKYEKWW